MKGKVPVLITILGLIATIFFFSSKNKLEEELSANENVKAVLDKQVEIYRDIDSHYGRASNEFYANKPVVLLRGSGATEVIRIYWEKAGDVPLTATADWDNSLKGDWGDLDGKWSPFSITSKIPKGYQTIRFTNEANDEAFSVLVIIK